MAQSESDVYFDTISHSQVERVGHSVQTWLPEPSMTSRPNFATRMKRYWQQVKKYSFPFCQYSYKTKTRHSLRIKVISGTSFELTGPRIYLQMI